MNRLGGLFYLLSFGCGEAMFFICSGVRGVCIPPKCTAFISIGVIGVALFSFTLGIFFIFRQIFKYTQNQVYKKYG